MSNFEIREDDNGIGKVLILKGAWSDDIATYMQENEIFALRLTDSFGFKGHDISFIPSLTFLRSGSPRLRSKAIQSLYLLLR